MVHHGRGLFRLTKNQDLVDSLKLDFRNAAIEANDLAMLAYADKITRNLPGCEESDVQTLHSRGFSDTEILDIVQVAAYYNYVNRLASALGVEMEPSEES